MKKSVGRPSMWDNPGPDEGWSWVILVCNCLFVALVFGFYTTGSTGILFIEFVSAYGITRKDAAWPFSVIGIMQCIAGLSYGFVSNWLNMQKLVLLSATLCSLGLVLCFWATDIIYISITFGVLYGCGYGLYMSTSLLYLNQSFNKFKATANVIFMTSSPLAGLVLPYLVNTLVNEYGLRGAFLLMGGVIMQLFVAASLMRPRTPDYFPCLVPRNPLLVLKTNETNGKPPPAEDKSQALLRILLVYKNVVMDPMFYVLTTQAVVSLNIFVGISLTVTDYALDNHLTKENGILLLTIFSIADVVGRIFFSLLTDRGCISSARISLVSSVIQGSSLCIFGMKRSLAWFIGVTLVSGLVEGGLATTVNVQYYHYIDRKNLPAAFGLRLFLNGLFAFLRPLLAGYFRDSYRSYIPFYYLLGGLSLWSAFLWSLEPCFVRLKHRQEEQCQQVSKMTSS